MSATLCSPFWFRFLCPLHAFCSAPMEQKKQRCLGGHTVLRRSSPDTPFHALFRVRFGVRSFVYICVRPAFFFLFTYKVRKRGGGFVLVCTVYGSVLVHCYIPEPSCLTDRCRVYFVFSHLFFLSCYLCIGSASLGGPSPLPRFGMGLQSYLTSVRAPSLVLVRFSPRKGCFRTFSVAGEWRMVCRSVLLCTLFTRACKCAFARAKVDACVFSRH